PSGQTARGGPPAGFHTQELASAVGGRSVWSRRSRTGPYLNFPNTNFYIAVYLMYYLSQLITLARSQRESVWERKNRGVPVTYVTSPINTRTVCSGRAGRSRGSRKSRPFQDAANRQFISCRTRL